MGHPVTSPVRISFPGIRDTHFDVDFDCALNARGVGLETRPRVFGWSGDQAAGYGVAMQVAQFFEALGGGKDVEVVITREPEGRFGELL